MSTAPGGETQALWQEYRATRDRGLRDRLILTYAPLVKFVAGRLGSNLPAHVDDQDLVSYGLLGLIGAIERYDPGREIKFETYAIARIKGAIIDELRSLDWVPRSVRARAREIERAIVELERGLMRAPTDAEIAGKVGISEDELEKSLSDISRSSMAALDELWSPQGASDQVALIDTIEDTSGPDPEFSLEQTELNDSLAEAIARLPEREKLVVTLYYYEELTLREIGEVLGVTESRVSQLHTKAVLRLKARLSGAVRADRRRLSDSLPSATGRRASSAPSRRRRVRPRSSGRRPRRRRARGCRPRRPRPRPRRRRRARTSTLPPQSPSGEVSTVESTSRAPAGTTSGGGDASSVLSIEVDDSQRGSRATTIVTVDPVGARVPGAGSTPRIVPAGTPVVGPLLDDR